MKLTLITFLAVLVFASVGGVGLAHAQEDPIGQANIPFDFYAGKQKMPAGSYSIKIELETGVITFTERSGKGKMFLMGTPKDESDGTSLLEFNHFGNVYTLDELKSDAYDWVFQTRMPLLPIESRNASSHVEVALN